MVVGINSRNEDIAINVCKEKHLTNTRASGSDEALRLVPPLQMSLEKSLEMALFYVYANKPIYTKRSPKIYLHNDDKEITQVDILQFKDIITKNLFFKKYMRDTSQSLLIQDKKVYEDEDNERIQELSSQLSIKERDLFMLNLKLSNRKQYE